MNTSALALRNLLRNRRRALTTLLAATIGALAIILFGGYSQSIILGVQSEYVGRLGHLQVQRQGYFRYGAGQPEDYGIASYERVMALIKKDEVLAPMIRVVTPTLQFGGIAGNAAAGTTRMVQGWGVMADDAAAMRLWNDYDFPAPPNPNYLTSLAGTPESAAMVGNGLARMLRLCAFISKEDCQVKAARAEVANADSMPQDIAALSAAQVSAQGRAKADNQIDILAANAFGAPNVVQVQVIHSQDQGVKELDDIAVQLHLSQAQKLVYGRGQPAATSIVIQLKHTDQMEAARARLSALLAGPLKAEGLEVLDFQTISPLYGQAINMFQSIFTFMALLIGVIVLFTIGNTMSMAIVERTVEIGTLRAMGQRRRGIQNMFICEGFMLGAMGALSGIGLALLAAYGINHAGWSWVPPGRAEPVWLTVRVWGSPGLMLGTFIGLTAVAVFSSWAPARRAARMDVVAALRHV